MEKVYQPMKHSSYFEMFRRLASSWGWVVAFVLVCLLSYTQAYRKKCVIRDHLVGRYESLVQSRNRILEHQSELQHQINSQSDPLWIQMTLMKGLGLVPEGQMKILFQEE